LISRDIHVTTPAVEPSAAAASQVGQHHEDLDAPNKQLRQPLEKVGHDERRLDAQQDCLDHQTNTKLQSGDLFGPVLGHLYLACSNIGLVVDVIEHLRLLFHLTVYALGNLTLPP